MYKLIHFDGCEVPQAHAEAYKNSLNYFDTTNLEQTQAQIRQIPTITLFIVNFLLFVIHNMKIGWTL